MQVAPVGTAHCCEKGSKDMEGIVTYVCNVAIVKSYRTIHSDSLVRRPAEHVSYVRQPSNQQHFPFRFSIIDRIGLTGFGFGIGLFPPISY